MELRWYLLPADVSPAVIIGEKACGVYVLQFNSGDRYVGQAVNIAHRITEHRHGKNHDRPWTDIVAFAFLPAGKENMNRLERETIERQKAQGYRLRNVTFNLDTTSPRPIDSLLDLKAESHWATGQERYISSGHISLPPRRTLEEPHLFRKKSAHRTLSNGKTIADTVIDDLAFAVKHLIPNAPELEGEYWSISDCPSTAGGRYATLNVGNLELMFFPLRAQAIDYDDDSYLESVCYLNMSIDSETPDEDQMFFVQDSRVFRGYHFCLVRGMYPLTETKQMIVPIGSLRRLPARYSKPFISHARRLPLQLMRRSRNTLFNRHHSLALADAVYERIRQS